MANTYRFIQTPEEEVEDNTREKIIKWLNDSKNNESDLIDFLVDDCGLKIDYALEDKLCVGEPCNTDIRELIKGYLMERRNNPDGLVEFLADKCNMCMCCEEEEEEVKMDIQTKVGIELIAKSYYDEWREQKKALEEEKKKALEEEEEEEEEEEFNYEAYQTEQFYTIKIQVAGGGMMNGNAYANIEGEWATEGDYLDNECGNVYYCEYGLNPSKEYVGMGIEWNDEHTKFKVIEHPSMS